MQVAEADANVLDVLVRAFLCEPTAPPVRSAIKAIAFHSTVVAIMRPFFVYRNLFSLRELLNVAFWHQV